METKVLAPKMMIDVREILDDWLEEWNETPETSSEDWSLMAFPVLADGRVALLFGSTVCAYTTSNDGETESFPIENRYRVLVFDPMTGELDGRFRFRVYDGYAATVFFKDGKLFAVVSGQGESNYAALQMWPGCDEEHLIRIGEDITCLTATEAGDIIASYEVDEMSEEDMEGQFEEAEEENPLISIFHADGTRENFGWFFDETGELADAYVIDLTLDHEDRIWAMLDDENTAVVLEKDGGVTAYMLPVEGVTALAMPDDCSCLYANVPTDDDEGYMLYNIPLAADDSGDDEEEEDEAFGICDVATPDGDVEIFHSCSFLKNIMAVSVDEVIYIIDLNEQ